MSGSRVLAEGNSLLKRSCVLKSGGQLTDTLKDRQSRSFKVKFLGTTHLTGESRERFTALASYLISML